MAQNVWELPGPGGFVRRVADAFRDGRSVCVHFPRHAPEGFPQAVRTEYEREPFLEISSLRYDGAACRPLDFLFEYLAADARASVLRDALTLTEQPGFWGRLIFLEVIDAENWTPWRKFLAEYEQVCRNVERLHRSLFFVCLNGETATPPGEDVCQAVFRWSGMFDDLDMALFAARHLSGKSLIPLERQLIVSLLTELSLWDPETCARLAGEPLENLLTPVPLLYSFAEERGWNASTPQQSWWELGIEDTINGARQRHSAFLALRGEERELDRRIWRAQLRVLFPAIEELRVSILPELKRCLRLPIQTPFGIVRQIEDLEIGQIAHSLHSVRAVDRQTRDLVFLLRDLRHALAHLEPVRDTARLRRLCQSHERLQKIR